MTSSSIRLGLTLIVASAALFLLWVLRSALLLVFGAILVSVFLDLITVALLRLAPLRRGLALAIATFLVLGVVGASLWLFGSSFAAEVGNILDRIQTGERTFDRLLDNHGIDSSVFGAAASHIDGVIAGLLRYALNGAEVAAIVAVMGIFLAAEPRLYLEGLARLVPTGYRGRVTEVVTLIGASLRLWLLGQMMLMVIVGVVTFVALSALGVPNAGALALVAGATEAVPYLGPFIGAVPAVLVGLSQSIALAAWIILVYLLAHVIEGYLIGPILQRWCVRIPPALVLASLFMCQLIFGFAGLILAAPLAVAVFAAVKILYVRDTLHRTVELPDRLPLE